MTKKQLAKVRTEFENIDMSRYISPLFDELLKINGGGLFSGSSGKGSSSSKGSSTASKSGASSISKGTGKSGSNSNDGVMSKTGGREVANTNEAVAHAKPGDTVTRSDGTKVTISQGDINYAKSHSSESRSETNTGKNTEPSKSSSANSANLKTSNSNNNSKNNNSSEKHSETVLKTEATKIDSAKKTSESKNNTKEVASDIGETKNPAAESKQNKNAATKTEKSGHGFLGRISEAVSGVKNTFCDFFGIGKDSKSSESADSNNVPVNESAKQKITESIQKNGNKKYNEKNNGYKCDNWVEEVLTDAGYNAQDYLPAGKASEYKVAQHIDALKKSGNAYSTTIPNKEGVYVVFMDGKGSLGTLDPHCGILTVSSGNEMSFTHNSSSNDNYGVDTWSVTSQNNDTKLSNLAYSNFYFQEIK